MIINNTHYKNPPANDGITPLHLAAKYGKLAVVQWIFCLSIGVKNPKDYYGYTPLHYAAESGYLAICQLIITNVEDKNPGGIPEVLHLCIWLLEKDIAEISMMNFAI